MPKLFPFGFFLLTGFLLTTSCTGVKTTEVLTLASTGASWNGSTLPAYPEGNPEVTVLKITIPPGIRLATHKHSVINAGVMLKGKLTVVSEAGDTLHLKAGDSIVELVNQWHYGENPSKTKDVELIVFYAGLEGQPFTLIKNSEKKH